ncbi:Peptidase C78- ubiquitin fold modifier-specific peptidase 1/ 2 [Striga hermonthica]|uniref:Peptidase C78- ubiquitin fold modifier-specific peptidase 1/ 2 n=1 Tax=Striga hermonthica TaxID=68872 RepID=A0A9N7NGD6_STRHE|nr:Peptidase C78- ubiquitin fold modifier-specific peptidase 1/ 2 [Striga hermonthica]
MEFSTCPICNLSFPSMELQRHANDHFTEEDSATDFELAQQIALFPPSPPRITGDSLKCTLSSLDIPQPSSYTCDAKITGYEVFNHDEKHASLVHPKNMEKFYKVEGKLMTLLKNCLETEPGDTLSILCRHIDHFESIRSWDGGWGCGWRNIQMLSSYLLAQSEESRGVLYGGCGFVPNIRTIQCWLELAWGKGFDTPGSDDFDQKIYGKRNWIGTTECAALFRSFGLRARIVDFCSKNFQFGGLGRKNKQVYGPMDVFLSKGKMHLDKSSKHHDVLSEKAKCHQVLTEWVWNYFSGSSACRTANCRVVFSEKSPLYFQHDGHSRTIVGIQAKHLKNRTKQYNLLILEPSDKTRILEKSLIEKSGWQKFIKRGVHTLKKPLYQVCYVDPGIARGEELERLKTINSSRCEF